ncbi:MAG: hypothetical protein HW384_672 [Dehalococcoidia bacterium]|nr:hypothetical protein [Dehalococcoidia bacterium]
MQVTLPPQFEGCTVRRCRKEQCNFGIGRLSSQIIIVDCDLYKQKHNFVDKICDFLLFAVDYRQLGIVLELKGGRLEHIDDIVVQLQNGANIIVKLAGNVVSSKSFFAVVLHGGSVHRNEFTLLRKKSVFFKGKAIPLRLGRCGANIREIIDDR